MDFARVRLHSQRRGLRGRRAGALLHAQERGEVAVVDLERQHAHGGGVGALLVVVARVLGVDVERLPGAVLLLGRQQRGLERPRSRSPKAFRRRGTAPAWRSTRSTGCRARARRSRRCRCSGTRREGAPARSAVQGPCRLPPDPRPGGRARTARPGSRRAGSGSPSAAAPDRASSGRRRRARPTPAAGTRARPGRRHRARRGLPDAPTRAPSPATR
jgi:hypothetical protein